MVAEVTINFRSGSRGSQLADVAEQEVDVEAALVGLVDDQRVVAAQRLRIAFDLGKEDAIGHHLDPRLLADTIHESNRVADGCSELAAHLLGDLDRRSCVPLCARLCVADHPVDASAGTQGNCGNCVLLPDPVSPATITA